ncbi:MAG: ribokinase [Acidobacteria bacterium]|nr:ribokinase [Acidobacteriota bacterium]
MTNSIFVLGSLNADLVIQADRLPTPGETLQGSDLSIYPGGKGANQACAAARLGAKVAMFGAVGQDVFGDLLLESLTNSGVDSGGVVRSERATGSASITVLPNGENSILLSPGANASVSASWVEGLAPKLSADQLVLCQLEVPFAAVEALLKISNEKGARVILDPAPAIELSPETLRLAEIVTPNQAECAVLLNRESQQPRTFEEGLEACRGLHARGVRTAIVKMGDLGCVVSDGNESFAVEAYQVDPIDTTAAGDTFNAGLAAALATGSTLREAVEFGNEAAALSVTRPGAQSSAPSREEVERQLQSR